MQAASPIDEKLREVTRRLITQALLESLALAVGVAGLGFVILWWTMSWTPAAVLYGSLAMLALTFIAAAMVSLLRLPGPVLLAQKVDGHFKLDERISAAVEGQASYTPGLVADLQRADALKYVNAVDPAAMIPVRISRPTSGLLALAAVSLLVTLILPPATIPAVSPVTTQRDFSQQEKNQLAEEIRRVAESLTADAQELENDYLSAVARSLDDLSQQLDRGEVNRPELVESLGRITEHLTLADNSATEQIERLIELGQQELADTPASPAMPADPAVEQGQAEGFSEDSAQAQPSVPIRELNAGGDSDGDGIGPDPDLEVNAEDLRDAPQLLAMEDNSATARHYMEPDPEMVARLEERRQQMLAEGAAPDGAVPVGAAQQSTPGGGDIGGEGAGQTSVVEQTDVDFAFDTDALQLPASSNTEGQRITVEASPDTVFTETGGAAQFAFSHWLPSEEAPLDQSLIGLRQQDAVRRYFLPLDPEDEQSNQKGTTQ